MGIPMSAFGITSNDYSYRGFSFTIYKYAKDFTVEKIHRLIGNSFFTISDDKHYKTEKEAFNGACKIIKQFGKDVK